MVRKDHMQRSDAKDKQPQAPEHRPEMLPVIYPSLDHSTRVQRVHNLPDSLVLGDILHLQQTIGNQALGQLMAKKESPMRYQPVAQRRGLIQREKVADYGAEMTRTWYSDEINATGIESALKAVVASRGDKSGVWVSDSINDWQQGLNVGTGKGEQVNQLIVPHLEKFLKNPQSMPQSLQQNGLDVLANCKMVAEHEMIHLKHASVNAKYGNAQGADTTAFSFSPANIQGTVNTLKDTFNSLNVNRSGNIVTRLKNIKEFVIRRLNYILNTYQQENKNSEAPAVMRELNRYLTQIIQPTDTKEWHNAKDTIVNLDNECSEIIMSESKKECIIS